MSTVSIACAIPHGVVIQNGGGAPTGNDPIILPGPQAVSGLGAGRDFVPGDFSVTEIDAGLWVQWSATHGNLVTAPGGGGVWQID